MSTDVVKYLSSRYYGDIWGNTDDSDFIETKVLLLFHICYQTGAAFLIGKINLDILDDKDEAITFFNRAVSIDVSNFAAKYELLKITRLVLSII